MPAPRFRRSLLQPRKRRRVLLAQIWWEDRVLRGVAAYAAEHDWILDCRMRWTHRLPPAGLWSGDGIIANIGVSPWLRPASRPLLRFVRAAGVPVVDTQEFNALFQSPKVVVPHDAVGRLAAHHLMQLGFHRFGFVTFEENPLEQARRSGFQRVVEAAGHTFVAFTAQTLARQLPRLEGPLALFAYNDLNALQVTRLCLDAGRRVPEEFAVLGADDTDILCDLAAVPLSSVSCDFERQGYEAAALLDRLMDGKAPPAQPILIPPRGVTVRRSTDTIAIPDLATARMLRFLRDHHAERFSLQQAATELGVPLRRAQAGFRTHLGHTLLQELNRLRIEHARRLLPDRTRKLETIAHECGFSSRFHFIQAFRRITGTSPRNYRASLTASAPVAAGPKARPPLSKPRLRKKA